MNKIKHFFIYTYAYLKGVTDAFIFISRWTRDHKELVKMKKKEGMKIQEIWAVYARDAIQNRFRFTDEQMNNLYPSHQKQSL